MTAIAYHEAGHAVVAMLQGIDVGKISMVLDTDGEEPFIEGVFTKAEPAILRILNGTSRIRPMSVTTKSLAKKARSHMLVTAAGAAAQKRYELGKGALGSPTQISTSAVGTFMEGDHGQLIRMACIFADCAIGDFVQGICLEAEQLMSQDEVWAKVTALAKRLKPDVIMTGDLAAKIVAAA